jgi:hypothetical protein
MTMEELFSCRNCIHNSGQSINAGRGKGYCQLHRSVIEKPFETTCKYLHRKDLPQFLVEEGTREHAYEFALFSGLVTLKTKKPIPITPYSEKYAWEHGEYNSLLNALAQYHKTERSWVFIQAFSGGIDGLRSLTHASLVRRYMDRCATWKSSYRLVLSLIQELDVEPRFEANSVLAESEPNVDEAVQQALWDVVFARICGIQEYGWHAGLEHLIWITDSFNGGLAELDFNTLRPELARVRKEVTLEIIDHAKNNNAFFIQFNDDMIDNEYDPLA